jgi:signal transduction histidine kinase
MAALQLIHPMAYHLPAMGAIAESLITMLALLGALLLWAQFVRSRRLRDLILLGAVAVFTAVELTFSALPRTLPTHSGAQFGAALQLALLLIAAAIATAALIPSNKLVAWDRRPVAVTLALSFIAFAAAELCGLLLRSKLILPAAHPVAGIGRTLGHPVASTVGLLTSGLFVVAAARFAHRGNVEGDDALAMLAGAAALLAAAVLSYLMLPWLSRQWITGREELCLVAFLLVVASAALHERSMRARRLRAAEVAERRRVARDLHDGLAQDLAFIAAYGPQCAQELGAAHPLTIAATRALAVSRGAICDLSDWRSTTPRDALEAIAHELGERFQITIAVDADAEADLPAASRAHVLRIAREAIANAGRHGGAKNVLVSLSQTGDGLALLVRDDGCRFPSASGSDSCEEFGLREHAASLGGELTVRQRDGGGTSLKVVLP